MKSLTPDQKGTTITLMDKITAAHVIDQVRRFAAIRPNHVYLTNNEEEMCRYFEEDGQPGCIVGHALYALGFGECEEFVSASEVLPLLHIDGTIEQYRWLDTVQHAQDQKNAWGVAVRVGDGLEEMIDL